MSNRSAWNRAALRARDIRRRRRTVSRDRICWYCKKDRWLADDPALCAVCGEIDDSYEEEE